MIRKNEVIPPDDVPKKLVPELHFPVSYQNYNAPRVINDLDAFPCNTHVSNGPLGLVIVSAI